MEFEVAETVISVSNVFHMLRESFPFFMAAFVLTMLLWLCICLVRRDFDLIPLPEMLLTFVLAYILGQTGVIYVTQGIANDIRHQKVFTECLVDNWDRARVTVHNDCDHTVHSTRDRDAPLSMPKP